MTRRLARITHDEVRRAVKAVQACGLEVGGVEIDGSKIRVLVGKDSGEKPAEELDTIAEPETVQSLAEWQAWREKDRARGN